MSNWLGPRGQGRRLGARHLGRRPTQDKDVDALEAIKLDELLDQGAGCGLPSSTQRSDYELADHSSWMPSSLSPCRRSADAEVAAADEVIYKESQVQYIGEIDAQIGSRLKTMRKPAGCPSGGGDHVARRKGPSAGEVAAGTLVAAALCTIS